MLKKIKNFFSNKKNAFSANSTEDNKNKKNKKPNRLMSVLTKEDEPYPTKEEFYKNPWQAAQRVHDDRIGNAYVRAYNWRIISLCISAIALVAVFGMIFIAAQKKFVPYVVEVDKFGNAAATTFIEKTSPTDSRIIKAYLGRFITDWRSVSSDIKMETSAVKHLYTMLAVGTPAVMKITDYFREASPIDRGKEETVSVAVTSVLHIADANWQVEWKETTHSLQGAIKNVTYWKASLSIVMDPPQKEEEIMMNPLGMFVTDINWSKQL